MDAQAGSALFARSGRQDEIGLEDFVGCPGQADVGIDPLGDGVVLLDVETDAGHVPLAFSFPQHVVVQLFEHAASSPFLFDVHALQPPKDAIPPVAPFKGDQHLPDRPPGGPVFHHHVKPLGGVRQQRFHTGLEEGPVQFPALGFPGESQVKRD